MLAMGEIEVSLKSSFLKGSAVCPAAELNYKYIETHAPLGEGGWSIKQTRASTLSACSSGLREQTHCHCYRKDGDFEVSKRKW